MPAVSYCTNLIAGTLAGLPWRVQRGDERLDDSQFQWIFDPMALRWDQRMNGPIPFPRPAEQMSVVDIRTQWITSALWFGDGYLYSDTLDSAGQPKPPLMVIHPHKVKFEDGRYHLDDGYELDPAGMVHLRGMPPYLNGHGSGVITTCTQRQSWDWRRRCGPTHRGSSRPGSPSRAIPEGQRAEPDRGPGRPRAQGQMDGTARQRVASRSEIAILNATTDFTPIASVAAGRAAGPGAAVVDAGRRHGVRCRRHPSSGIPGDSSTYSNVESPVHRAANLHAAELDPPHRDGDQREVPAGHRRQDHHRHAASNAATRRAATPTTRSRSTRSS